MPRSLIPKPVLSLPLHNTLLTKLPRKSELENYKTRILNEGLVNALPKQYM